MYSVSWAGREEDKIFVRQGEKSAMLRPRNSFKVSRQVTVKKSFFSVDLTRYGRRMCETDLLAGVLLWYVPALV